MKKLIIIAGLVISLFGFQVAPAMAQGTILPKAGDNCEELLSAYEQNGYNTDIARERDKFIGCAITTGRISLTMVPYFIQYFSNYLLGIVSLLALLFVVIGGFRYTLGGMTDDKAKGKTYITNALIGMVIAFMAWTIVNVIISAITG